MKKYSLVLLLLFLVFIACSYRSEQTGTTPQLTNAHFGSVAVVLHHLPAGSLFSRSESLLYALPCTATLLHQRLIPGFLLPGLLVLLAGSVTILLRRNRRLRRDIVAKEQQLQQQMRPPAPDKAECTGLAGLPSDKNAKNGEVPEQHSPVEAVVFHIIDQYKSNIYKKRKDVHPFDAKIDNPAFFKAFVAFIDLVHHNFSHRLKSAYPCLSEHDILICCLLLAGFDSGMIATVLDIQADSVGKSRYRIRARLGLETNEKMVTFLKNF